MKRKRRSSSNPESGFSLIELMVVMGIIVVMTAIVVFYASSYKRVYKADEQALMLADMLQEGRQRALTQRVTMRVEVNLTTNTASLYNENSPTVDSDDVLLKKINLYTLPDINIGTTPAEISALPPETLAVPNAVFKTSVYPPSISQNVCTIRFLSNGSVVDAGTNSIGSGSVATGLTLQIWQPNKTTPTNSDTARALTVLGATGAIRLWEYDHSSTATNKWKDNRRGA
jgi:prepilin-type N-terminal cleavage/methylation domain-containing protein